MLDLIHKPNAAGAAMVWWFALLHHSYKDPNRLAGCLSVCPTVRRRAVSLIGDSKSPVGVNVSVNNCLSLLVSPMVDCPGSIVTAGSGPDTSATLNRKRG